MRITLEVNDIWRNVEIDDERLDDDTYLQEVLGATAADMVDSLRNAEELTL